MQYLTKQAYALEKAMSYIRTHLMYINNKEGIIRKSFADDYPRISILQWYLLTTQPSDHLEEIHPESEVVYATRSELAAQKRSKILHHCLWTTVRSYTAIWALD